MKKTHVWQALLSVFLTVTLLAPNALPGFAREEDPNDAEYQKILAELEHERNNTDLAENYPGGIFSVAIPAVEISESLSDPLVLYVLRHGGTEGEATVHLKFNDYSARYGEDYTVKMKDSFFSRAIPEKENSVPLLYMMGGEESGITDDSFVSYEAMVEAYGQEAVDEMMATMEKMENPEEAEKEIPNEIPDKSPLEQFNNDISMYADGVDTDEFISESEIDPETAALSHDLVNQLLVYSETDVVFEDGEQIKPVYVYPKNDKESNGERSFSMVISSGTGNENIDSNNTSSVVIKDDEPTELSELYIDSSATPSEVQIADGKFTATIKRDNALYNISTANFFAVTDTNRVLLSGQVLLMPGMQTQTVDVPFDTANLSGASTVSLYLEDGTGCNVSGERVEVQLKNGDEDLSLFGSDSAVSYSVSNSPIGFAGKGTYSGFDIYPNTDNFKVDINDGKTKDTTNAYQSDDTWVLKIPDKTCSWKNTKLVIQSKQMLNYAVADYLEIDWQRDDYELAKCNRQIFSTNNSFHYDRKEETYDNEGGTYRFYSDFNGKVKIYAKTGRIDPATNVAMNTGSVKRMGNNTSDPSKAADPAYMHFMVWKTSGGVNGSLIKLRNIHVAYRQYKLHINPADNINGQVPGVMKMVSRDARTISDNMSRYATETISLQDSAPNNNYKLKKLQIKNGNSWVDVDSKFFNAESMTLYLTDDFLTKYYPYAINDYTSFEFKPVYEAKKIQVTLQTTPEGGITFNGTSYPANSGSHTVTVNAGSSVTLSPYDAQEGYAFTDFTGSRIDVLNSANSWDISFQQNASSQNLTLEYYNYKFVPVYTAEGTFLRIDTPNGVPEGCEAPGFTFYSFIDGNLKSGQALQLHAVSANGYAARWRIKNQEHPWYSDKTYCGDHFDYRVINGGNVIELTFEKVTPNNYAALSGTVVSYQGTILNPPISDGMGGYAGDPSPVSGATVSFGKFSAITDKDGHFRLYEYTAAQDGSGENQTSYLRLLPNEQYTIRIMCRNMESIYLVKTSGGKVSETSTGSPAELSLATDLTTDFYGSGPVPASVEVLLGLDAETAPVVSTRMGAVPLSNNTVGFKLTLDSLSEEYPLSRVDFKVLSADGALRTKYSVQPKGNSKEFLLEEYSVQMDDGTPGSMYFNSLLNFRDGDKIYVDLVGTISSGGSSMDISYGEYDTGISFYQVPGQDLNVGVPQVAASEKHVPSLDMVGAMLPKITMGPLSVNAIINESSMNFMIGFNVGLLNKTLKHQKDPSAPAPIRDEILESKENLDKALKDGLINEDEYNAALRDLETDVLDAIDVSDSDNPESDDEISEAVPPITTEEIAIETPTAEELQNANKTVANNNLDPLATIKGADKLIDSLKKAHERGGGAGVKDALAKAKGGISLNIGLSVGVSFTFVMNAELKTWVFESALVYAQASGAVSGLFYIVIPSTPIPCYIGFSVALTVGLYAGVGSYRDVTFAELSDGSFQQVADERLYFKGNIPVMLGIEIFVGVGIQKLLCLQLTGGFLQQFNFGYGQIGNGNGSTTFYGAVDIALVIFSTQWRFAQQTWKYSLYDYDTMSLNSYEKPLLEQAASALNTPLADMTVTDTAYVNRFIGGGDSFELMGEAGSSTNSTILEDTTNVISYLVPLDSDNTLLVYTSTDESRPMYNRHAAYYTIGNGSSWTEPKLLDEAPTLDMGLFVKDLGDEVLISWNKSQKEFTESDFEAQNGTNVLKVLSSADVYTIIAPKADILATNALPAATKLTQDYTGEGDEALGYGHLVNGAVKLSDGRIYEFYTSTDYRSYGEKGIETLSDLLGTPGIMMYRIYENGQWLDSYYPVETQYKNYADFYGQRLADINVKDADGNTHYPLTGLVDMETIVVNGKEIIGVTYVYDSDSNLATTTDRTVCLSVLEPDGQTHKTSLPLQLSDMTDVSHPTLHKLNTDKHGVLTIATWAQNNEMMYADLTHLFGGEPLSEESKAELEESFLNGDESYSNYTNIEELFADITKGVIRTTVSLNGRDVSCYILKDSSVATQAFPNTVDANGQNTSAPGNGFDVFSGSDGNMYVIWSQSKGSEQPMMISALNVKDDENGSYRLIWSPGTEISVKVDEDEKEYITDPVGCVLPNHTLFAGYNKLEMNMETSEDGKLTGSFDSKNNYCVSRFIPTPQSQWVSDITVSDTYPKAGQTFTAEGTFQNVGILTHKNISVKAELIAKSENGGESVVQTADAATTDELLPGGKALVTASFTMTQEMLDAAKGTDLDYYARFTVLISGMQGENAVSETEVFVGSKLEFVNRNVYRYNTRNAYIENGERIIGEPDGNVGYIINTDVVNVGNVTTENVGFGLEMENKNGFELAGSPVQGASSAKEFLENTPLNAHVIHNEDHKTYFDASRYVSCDTASLAPGESAPVVMVSKSISKSMYSDNGVGSFVLSAYDDFADQDDLISADFFTDSLEEDTLYVRITKDNNKVTEHAMKTGGSVQLSANIYPKDSASGKHIVWASTDESVATVDGTGKVTAKGEGTAFITATIDGTEITNSVCITVEERNGSSSGGGGGVATYTVTFNTNGGTEIPAASVAHGGKLNAPTAPQKEGFTFGGWFTDAECTVPYDFASPVNSKLTLYAKWTEGANGWANPFSDVHETDWFFENVKYVHQNGLMNGTSETTFEPQTGVTRGMLVTVLHRQEGTPEPQNASTFLDVPEGSYYETAIRWAQENGIVNGYSETEFKPDEPVSREQIAAIMYRYATVKGTAPTGAWAIRLDYEDLADISEYALEGVMYCKLQGIMQGKDGNRFAPKDSATRAEIAAILERYIEYNKTE